MRRNAKSGRLPDRGTVRLCFVCWESLRAQGLDGVALGGALGGDQAAQNGEQCGQCNQHQCSLQRQGCRDRGTVGNGVDEHVAGDQQNQAQAHAHTAGAQTDEPCEL